MTISVHVSTYALVKAFLADQGRTKVFREPPQNIVNDVPLHVVSRFGGGRPVSTVDLPRIDVDTFAATEDTTEEIAEQVDVAIRTLLPGYLYGGSTVLRVDTMTAPHLVPWSSGYVFRANAAYELRIHRYVGLSAA